MVIIPHIYYCEIISSVTVAIGSGSKNNHYASHLCILPQSVYYLNINGYEYLLITLCYTFITPEKATSRLSPTLLPLLMLMSIPRTIEERLHCTKRASKFKFID